MKKSIGFLIVMVLLASLIIYTSCKKKEDVPLYGSISGVIKNSTGAIVESATISISPGNLSTSSDGSGKYSFSNLEPKTYSVTITKSGYAVKTMNVTVVASNDPSPGDATLSILGSIIGTVTNAQSNQPVQGATVTLSPGNSTTNTGNDGKYAFNSLEAKDYTIQVQKTGFTSNTKTVTVVVGQTTQGDITLVPVAASLSINLTSLDFGSNLTTLPFEIRNSGAGTLTWNVVENTNWLSVNPISGTTTTEVDAVSVTVDRTGLSQGTYSQSISITSDGGNATISVSLIIANPNAPTVTCANAINISQSTAEVSGNVTSIGSSNVTQRGHCWATSPNPTTSNNITTLGPTSATGTYTSSVSGLMANTTYYVRAYATNNSGTGYSTDQVFTTTSSPTVPSLTIAAANNITQTTADIAGAISNLGSGGVTEHGHCWSTSSNPTTSSYKTTLGATTSTGSYTSNLTNLAPNTTYYVKSYAINSAGTGYSSEVSFTTTSNPTAPIVTTGSVSNIAMTDATVAGGITSIGSSNVTQHGHCWGTGMNPTTSNSTTQLGNGAVGNFTSNLTGLTQGTTYYVRAYATNGAGTSYGSQQTFTTLSPSLPTVSTNSITNITYSSASGGGNVSNDGGATVTARGICWSTSSNPTVSGSHTTDGSGTGSFTSSITSLLQNTTYYVRAYATNSAGTAYGSQQTFTTATDPYIVSNGLLAYYKFDNQNANDELGSYNGVMVGGVTSSTDIIAGTSGSSMQFDGSSGYINVPYSSIISGTSLFTMNVWIKSSMSGEGGIYGCSNTGNGICINQSHKISFINGSFSNDISASLLNSQWHMLTIVREGSALEKYYIDGVLHESINVTWVNLGSCPGFRIGFIIDGGIYYYFNGKMDNVRFYNRAITQQEVTLIYNAKQ